MNSETISQQYVLCDGEICAVELSLRYGEPAASKASVQLKVRKKTSKNAYESCFLRLELGSVTEVSLTEDFGAAYYSDIVLARLDNGLFYLSLDPYGNSGVPHAQDNLVIKAKTLTFQEIAPSD